jgi:hypothetical protein
MPLAMFLNHFENIHVHQGGEHNGFGAFCDSAVWLICRTAWCALSTVSSEWQSNMARLHLELGQDGVAKGFGGDASAVRDEKYGAVGHACQLQMLAGSTA